MISVNLIIAKSERKRVGILYCVGNNCVILQFMGRVDNIAALLDRIERKSGTPGGGGGFYGVGSVT